jgi:hypothetical protein
MGFWDRPVLVLDMRGDETIRIPVENAVPCFEPDPFDEAVEAIAYVHETFPALAWIAEFSGLAGWGFEPLGAYVELPRGYQSTGQLAPANGVPVPGPKSRKVENQPPDILEPGPDPG